MISRSEAAQILGVDEQSISNYVEQGLLSYKQVGSRKLKFLYRSEVEDIKDQFKEYHANRQHLTDLIIEQEKIRRQVEKHISSYRSRLEDLCTLEDLIFKNLKTTLLLHRDLYTDREQYIIDHICGSDFDKIRYADLADALGLTRERVRQIATKILRKLVERQEEQDKIRKQERDHLREIENKLAAYQIAEKIDQRRSTQNIEGFSSDIFNTRLVDCNLSVRSLNCIKAADIDTIADLVIYSKSDLLKFRNFGKKSLAELDDLVEQLGLHFGMSENEIFGTAITYTNTPDYIFLHTGVPLIEGDPQTIDFNELSEVTWNSERISDTDLTYQRIK